MTTVRKEVYTAKLEKLDDWQLIAGPLWMLYTRHKASLWMTLAILELTFIVVKELF